MKLILGSQSKNRQEVLRRAGLEFEVVTADIDEKAIRHDDYQQLPLLLARAKADTIAPKIKESALLITADTVTVYAGKLQEKPIDRAEARQFLEAYDATTPILVHTGVVVTNTATGQRADGMDTSELTIQKIPADLLQELLDDPVTYTVAGGFTVYDPRFQPLIVQHKGTIESVAGLSLHLLRQLMREVGA